MRLIIYFIATELSTYHKVSNCYSVMRTGDSRGVFQWIGGTQYGPFSYPGKIQVTQERIQGTLAQSLCKVIHDFAAATTLNFKINPMVSFTDLSFCPRLSDMIK